MARLTIHTPESAPAAAHDRLAAARKNGGFIPNLLGVLANAPTALEAYQTVSAINGRNSLTPTEREVIQITAAARNGCDFCVAGHTTAARKKLQLSEQLLDALRTNSKLQDPKLNALAQFTLAVIAERGAVSDLELQRFLDAGYNKPNALEVVLGVSLATLCNYTNRLAQTPINPELQLRAAA